MTCTLCNSDLPKGEGVSRRNIRLASGKKTVDAPLCKPCCRKVDTDREEARSGCFAGMLAFGTGVSALLLLWLVKAWFVSRFS